MDDCRLSSLAFDIAASAGWYSSIAGLLAGFAFVAVLLPLDHRGSEQQDSGTGDAVVAFVCAFFSLLILAITYAVLAGRVGEGPVAGVAAHEQMLNGAAFGAATLLLLFGLRGVLRSFGANREVFEPAQGVILVVTSVVGPAMLLALQFSNSLDVERYRLSVQTPGSGCVASGLPPGVWINLAITGLGLVAVVALAVLHERLPRREGVQSLVAKSVLAFTALTVFWNSIVLPLLSPATVAGALFEHVVLALTASLTVAFSASAWASR